MTSLTVGAGGTLQAAVDPTFAIGATNPTAIFDTTVHAGQSGPDGKATFADGAQIGVSLDALQTAQSATYVFVQTSGAPGALSIGNLPTATLKNSPFLYTATASADAADLVRDAHPEDPAAAGPERQRRGRLRLGVPGARAQRRRRRRDHRARPPSTASCRSTTSCCPTRASARSSRWKRRPRRSPSLTEQTPDAGTRIAGTSAWLQEVNQTIKRNDGETLGSTAKMFGLVGGYEKMGAAGGALGVTVAYLNIGDQGTAEPVERADDRATSPRSAPTTAAPGATCASRCAAAAATPGSTRTAMFVTTGVSETSNGDWNGYFADAHAGAPYEVHLGRFYLRPEASFDYLYLNENAHSLTRRRPRLRPGDRPAHQRPRDRVAAILTFGTQYGHDTWFRPEIFGGYRQVFVRQHRQHHGGASPAGGLPFTLSPGDVNGGWVVAGLLAESRHAALLRRHRGRGRPEEQRAALRRLPVRPGDVLSAVRAAPA